MSPQDRKTASLRAAFTADAAALGLHWLYDHDRLAQLAAGGGPLIFRNPDPAAYENVSGYFAHENRSGGDLSHYGEGMAVLADSLVFRGRMYDRTDYLRKFAAVFSVGYTGYRDKATRETLAHLAENHLPPGADDDQISATAKLPPLVVSLLEHPDLIRLAQDAATATNEHPLAREAAHVTTAVLAAALHGSPLPDALAAGVNASQTLRSRLEAALALTEFAPVPATQEFGPACGLTSALPLSFHLLNCAPSWDGLVNGNILAGGDSCGRATFIGAVWGAIEGLPEGWFHHVRDHAALDRLIARLVVS